MLELEERAENLRLCIIASEMSNMSVGSRGSDRRARCTEASVYPELGSNTEQSGADVHLSNSAQSSCTQPATSVFFAPRPPPRCLPGFKLTEQGGQLFNLENDKPTAVATKPNFTTSHLTAPSSLAINKSVTATHLAPYTGKVAKCVRKSLQAAVR